MTGIRVDRWSYTCEHSPHHHLRFRFWRMELHLEAWSNRYPTSTSRLCARFQCHYDRKHGKGYAA